MMKVRRAVANRGAVAALVALGWCCGGCGGGPSEAASGDAGVEPGRVQVALGTPPAIGPQTPVTVDEYWPVESSTSYTFSAATDGTDYLVAATAGASLRLVRVSGDGTVLDPEGVYAAGSCRNPQLFWTGGSYVLFCPYSMTFRSISRDLEVGPTVALFETTPTSSYTNAAFDGSTFLVVWATGGADSDVHGARVQLDGTRPDATPLVIADGPRIQTRPSVAWVGDTFYVAYADDRYTDVVSVDVRGTTVGTDGTVGNSDGDIIADSATEDENYPFLRQGDEGALLTWLVDPRWSSGVQEGTRIGAGGSVVDATPLDLGSGSTTPSDMPIASDWLVGGTSSSDGLLVRVDDGTTSTYPLGAAQPHFTGAWKGTEGLLVWQSNPSYDRYSAMAATVGTGSLTSEPFALLGTLEEHYMLDVASNGSGYAAAFIEDTHGTSNDQAKLTTLAANGSPTGPTVPLHTHRRSGYDHLTTLTCGEGAYLLARWDEYYSHLRVNAVGLDGQLLQSDWFNYDAGYRGARRFDAAWSGEDFLLVWDNGESLLGRRFGPTGAVLDTSNLTFTDSTGNETHPALAHSGSMHLLTWQDTRDWDTTGTDLYALRLMNDGTPADRSAIQLAGATGHQTLPHVAAVDDGWLVAWADDRPAPDGGLRIRGIDAEGMLVGTESVLVDTAGLTPTQIAIERGGQHVLVVWNVDGDIWALVVDLLGQPVEAPVQVAGGSDASLRLASIGADDWLLGYLAPGGGGTQRAWTRRITYGVPLGTACTASADCDGKPCVDGVCCNDPCGGGDPNDCQACSVAAGGSFDGVCTPRAAGATCRGATGVCDVAEQCDGVAKACPVDASAPDGTDCDDGDPCNGTAVCIDGACVAGAPPQCDDSNPCNGSESCDPGFGCVFGTPLDCDDGNVCNGPEVCDPEMGCAAGAPLDCDDGDPCTEDACDPASGCVHSTVSDGTSCGSGLVCMGGVCETAPPAPPRDGGPVGSDGGVAGGDAGLDAGDGGSASEDGGCSVSHAGTGGLPSWAWLLVLGAAILWRRRMRRQVLLLRLGKTVRVFAVAGAVTSAGCGEETRDGIAVPDGGIVEYDANIFEPPLPPAVVNPDGVLTPYPDVSYYIDDGYELLSVNYVIEEDGDSRGPLLTLYAEVKNTSTAPKCKFLPEVWLDATEIVAMVEAAPYYEDFSSVTSPCIPQGGVGVLLGVQRGVSTADLETAVSLDIMMNPFTYGTYAPAYDGPSVEMPTVTRTSDGWILEGELDVGATIYNYGLTVYPRDDRGLLFDELLAFPNDLGQLLGGSTVAFATDGAPRTFDDYRLFQSWIRD